MSWTDIADLTQLRTLVAVVQEGHLTRAAERLHISQPTASNHIRALESQFGVELFRRSSRGLEPTPEGIRLAQGAQQVLSSSIELTSLARELRRSPVSHLSIGTLFDAALVSRLPPLVKRIQQEHPAVEINVEGRNSMATKQGIRSGEIDAGFFVSSALEDDMHGIALKTVDYVVAGPHVWSERLRDAGWHELAALPWVMTASGTVTADLLGQAFQSRNLKPQASLAVNHDTLLWSMICGGIGVGLVRRETALEKEARQELAIAPHAHCSAELFFGYLRSRRNDAEIQLLMRSLKDAGFAQDDPAPGG